MCHGQHEGFGVREEFQVADHCANGLGNVAVGSPCHVVRGCGLGCSVFAFELFPPSFVDDLWGKLLLELIVVLCRHECQRLPAAWAVLVNRSLLPKVE